MSKKTKILGTIAALSTVAGLSGLFSKGEEAPEAPELEPTNSATLALDSEETPHMQIDGEEELTPEEIAAEMERIFNERGFKPKHVEELADFDIEHTPIQNQETIILNEKQQDFQNKAAENILDGHPNAGLFLSSLDEETQQELLRLNVVEEVIEKSLIKTARYAQIMQGPEGQSPEQFLAETDEHVQQGINLLDDYANGRTDFSDEDMNLLRQTGMSAAFKFIPKEDIGIFIDKYTENFNNHVHVFENPGSGIDANIFDNSGRSYEGDSLGYLLEQYKPELVQDYALSNEQAYLEAKQYKEDFDLSR